MIEVDETYMALTDRECPPVKTKRKRSTSKLLDAKPIAPAPVMAPQALRLANELKADVQRYDTLRGRAIG